MNEVLHAGLRGIVASMAMTGMRTLTISLGLVEEAPPRAILRKKAGGMLRLVPRKRRRAVVELVHWGYGAGGGMMFGALPEDVRRRRWSGPVYGLVLWLGFELGVAPAFGLRHAKERRLDERAALAVDHALYGLVLSETRSRPRQ